MLTDAITLSDTLLILPDAPPPALPQLFGMEPQHGWCYFYEKAELARQTDDWTEVSRLGREAFKMGLAPLEIYEWRPFIEAEARTGDVAEARKLSLRVSKENPLLNPGLCEVWARVGVGESEQANELFSQLKCQP